MRLPQIDSSRACTIWYMRIERDIAIDAPPDVVWKVIADVERWPDWTDSMESVRLLDGELRLGARAEVVQPKLPKAIWTVTRFDPGERFDWEAKTTGVTTVGRHWVEAEGSGSHAYLQAIQTGPLAPLLALLIGRLSERYVDLELHGLKERSVALR